MVPLIDDHVTIARTALREASRGEKGLVIRNTVGAAIATAQALGNAAGASHPVLFKVANVPALHHGALRAKRPAAAGCRGRDADW